MYLFIDFETTKKWVRGTVPQSALQPGIMEMSLMMADHDLRIVHSMTTLVQQTECDPETSQYHGITCEQTMRYGIPEDIAVKLCDMQCCNAEFIVSFGVDFDCNVLHAGMHRHGIKTKRLGAKLKRICMMRTMTPIVKLPPPWKGAESPHKQPKLSEAFAYAFGSQLKGAHRAEIDNAAAFELFKWHKDKMGVYPQPD